MFDLREVWSTNGWLQDENQDNVPDGMNLRVIADSYPLGLIDFGARLGLETTAANFDYLDTQSQYDYELSLINTSNSEAAEFFYKENGQFMITGTNLQQSHMLRFLASSWPQILEEKAGDEEVGKLRYHTISNKVEVFNQTGKLITEVNDPLYDEQNAVCNEKLTFNGLSDLWSISGLYQNERIDLASQTNIFFNLHKPLKKEVMKETIKLATRIGLYSTGIRFPLTNDDNNPRPAELEFLISETGTDEAQVSWEAGTGVTLKFTGGGQALVNSLKYFAEARAFEEGGDFGSWEHAIRKKEKPHPPVLYEDVWKQESEYSRMYKLAEKWIQGYKGDKEDSLELIAYLSEPLKCRQSMKEEIKNLLNRAGYTNHNILIRSAFKTGFLWIEEEVLPSLKKRDDLQRIGITARVDQHPDALELETRWLQELYPVDQFLSNKLGIDEDDITFQLDKELLSTYVVEAFDQGGHVIETYSINIPTSKTPYINPGKFSYPTTGELTIRAKEETVHSSKVMTDRECFWRYMLNQVLPKVKEVIEPLRGEGMGIDKPLFSHLRVDLELSEEERELDIDEENISSMEALHEDLYFNSLDYFERIGKETTRVPWTAPGGIHPFMKAVPGASPKGKVTLYGFEPKREEDLSTTALYFDDLMNRPIRAEMRLTSEEKTESKVLKQEEWSSEAVFKWEEEDVKDVKDLPGVRLVRGGVSYQGRDIPVIEVIQPSSSHWVSPHALSAWKPTVLIETGHHANEVSSMPAIRQLVVSIVKENPEWLNAFNLVVLPCANMDGRALHRELVKDNPKWKHHAARYNYVGLEYTNVRFRKTEFGEAEVIPNLIKRWLPDIMIDDHGIPSHEWVQPFAGYNSPLRFKNSFWMPNALVYGIARQLNRDTHPNHANVLDAMAKAISDRIRDDVEIYEKNQYWMKRYQKYGHQWLPDIFPVEETEGMLFFRWDSRPSRKSTAYIERYPEWCSLDLISEVADETVYDEMLDLCVRAQRTFNSGVLQKLTGHPQKITKEVSGSTIAYKRKRPLNVTSKEE
ncbi:hypothetical protein M3689_10955 [Alkalihalophilus marmarensis]|uniref:M14 family zinc carboxypeptidase n=1 Tax=Alkalihalophilus marmarensis TaxID=521377 RepID=UPI00203BC8A0|nr:M14 family zinc carboxypeptidase [Alkalihalophilus marmarensis]MCM3489826.1 hypothetical protein [Alkalihalophilus marmarensis]